MTTKPIDAVIAWVDGDDPAHAAKRGLYLEGNGKAVSTSASAASRFSDRGEIYYCIASILKHAGFIRRIYVVTADQSPRHLADFARAGICEADRIVVVDHKEIFRGYEQYLPTFNSLTIEAMLWRIPGLSENFVYLNDDFFINAPLSPSDFVGEDGKVVVYGRVLPNFHHVARLYLKKVLLSALGRNVYPGFRSAQIRSSTLFGLQQFVEVGHSPQTLTKSVFRDLFEEHPDKLAQQLAPRFRTADQFLPAGVSHHFHLRQGTIEVRPPADAYLKADNLSPAKLDDIRLERYLFGCIQNLEQFAPRDLKALRDVLARKFAGFLPASVLDWMREIDSMASQPDE
ncbi:MULTISPECIES: stealth family protein [unclassified Aminobacter]|uniref:stealth family protein n=1 Tax=unclassified Aminobacter TaxID=2644704 RepID=UPI000467A396|nr:MULTISPECIES: stealth family protein [unclassified Aminobacter]TWG67384.1 Stealth-like protein [Aminobacter sp. J44]TWH28669.1 Stealth-like protein [Aminobacter sp. J15]